MQGHIWLLTNLLPQPLLHRGRNLAGRASSPVKRSTWFFAKFGMRLLPITHAHSLALRELPLVHNDPFDRMLVAQAKNDGMVLMTADAILEKYPIEILWCGK